MERQMEELVPSCPLGGNADWYNHFIKFWHDLVKSKLSITCDQPFHSDSADMPANESPICMYRMFIALVICSKTENIEIE
jgi:hypothetical protein